VFSDSVDGADRFDLLLSTFAQTHLSTARDKRALFHTAVKKLVAVKTRPDGAEIFEYRNARSELYFVQALPATLIPSSRLINCQFTKLNRVAHGSFFFRSENIA